jgi:hypothetical protein
MRSSSPAFCFDQKGGGGKAVCVRPCTSLSLAFSGGRHAESRARVDDDEADVRFVHRRSLVCKSGDDKSPFLAFKYPHTAVWNERLLLLHKKPSHRALQSSTPKLLS